MSRIEDKFQTSRLKLQDGIKRHVFDVVAIIIMLSLVAASLDIFGIIDFREINIVEFLVSWFPYFAAAILLNTDLYKKGVFVGKDTTKFKNVISSYSMLANSLSGKQIKGLYPFCENYNEEAKHSIQKQILRKEGVIFSDFEDGSDGKAALKTLNKRELSNLGYTKRQILAIASARQVHVKGVNVNVLLSSMDISDVTRIGDDEKALATKQTIFSTIRYIFVTLLLSVIAIKDVVSWGLGGILLVLFKATYLFAGCYMSYFKGYDDVTINLANHFTRKIDILKMYLNYEPEIVTEDSYEDAKSVDNQIQ